MLGLLSSDLLWPVVQAQLWEKRAKERQELNDKLKVSATASGGILFMISVIVTHHCSAAGRLISDPSLPPPHHPSLPSSVFPCLPPQCCSLLQPFALVPMFQPHGMLWAKRLSRGCCACGG